MPLTFKVFANDGHANKYRQCRMFYVRLLRVKHHKKFKGMCIHIYAALAYVKMCGNSNANANATAAPRIRLSAATQLNGLIAAEI